MDNLKKLKAHRKDRYVEVHGHIVPTAEEAEKIMDIFSPDSSEVLAHETMIAKMVKEGVWQQDEHGNCYPTEAAATIVNDAVQE